MLTVIKSQTLYHNDHGTYVCGYIFSDIPEKELHDYIDSLCGQPQGIITGFMIILNRTFESYEFNDDTVFVETNKQYHIPPSADPLFVGTINVYTEDIDKVYDFLLVNVHDDLIRQMTKKLNYLQL